ncbi:MAG: CDP-glycerol glycerophosphotransferase family protein, partial [Bifidobacteriaceae bacterium]|nr:CDP-glycerol glycerophosphotransferase family protein [Bifidobacteriaceae bacterium]
MHKINFLKPRVSVIVATYNIENYVDECLRSFTNQYFLNLEILVIDDGSTDKTCEIIQKHKRKDFRVKFIKQPNQGLSMVRNNGMKIAKGDFVCFVDGDDKMERTAISDAVNSLQKTGSDFSVSYYFREEGGKVEFSKKDVLPPAYWIQYIHSQYRPKIDIDKFPALMQNTTAWGKVFRRKFLLDNNLTFIPNQLYEDQPFMAEAYCKAKNGVDVLDKVHYFWRIVETSISNQKTQIKDIKARVSVAKIALQIYKKNAAYNIFQGRLVQYLSHDFTPSLSEFMLEIKDKNSYLLNKNLKFTKKQIEWAEIFRDAMIYFTNFLDEEYEDKVNPLARVLNQIVIDENYYELLKFFEDSNFENRAIHVKKINNRPYLDLKNTFIQAQKDLQYRDYPIVDELVHLIETLYEIEKNASSEKEYTILGWAFLTCLDPKLFDYKYEFILDGRLIEHELFPYREVLKHDFSQSINFLSCGFKIKIPKYAKKLVIKITAGSFSRQKVIYLSGVIDHLLKKMAGEIEPEIFPFEWQKDSLKLDEMGSANHCKFIRAHQTEKFGAVQKNTVLFRAYYGEKCVDSALALHKDLQKRAPGKWKLYWAVKDLSVKTPEGATPVITGSKKWFKILSTCEVLVENVHQVDYFHKQTGQKVLQTFHGYPFKQMGHKDWQARGMPAFRIYSFDKRADQWDWVLSPAPYANPLYREAFKYKKAFIGSGYPRNDIFFDKEKCQKINREVRKKLKISFDKKVILYAPTYRDYLSTDEFHAEMVKSISNYKRFVEKLGSDYVLLVRGHMMNARAVNDGAIGKNLLEENLNFETSSQIKDVTQWDDVNDLIIA